MWMWDKVPQQKDETGRCSFRGQVFLNSWEKEPRKDSQETAEGETLLKTCPLRSACLSLMLCYGWEKRGRGGWRLMKQLGETMILKVF